MNPSHRAEGLDGLRGLAAAAIVLLHVWMFSGAHDPQYSGWVDDTIGTLGLSLMMFFVLSGYLVAGPWIRAGLDGRSSPNLGRYALKRAARILPAYWLCLLGSFAIARYVDHPLSIGASELPIFALFAQNQFDATAGHLNPPLWSLGVEVAFYLALPLIGFVLLRAARRSGPRGVLWVCGALIAGGLTWSSLVYAAGNPDSLLMALPTYLPIFACGIAAVALSAGRAFGRRDRGLLMTGGAVLVVLDGWWHIGGTGTIGQIVRDLPAAAGFAMLAAAVAQGPAKLLGATILRRLGDYSYGIYLWHMPLLYLLRHDDRFPDSPWLAYLMVMGAATVLGAASWLLLERGIVRWAAGRLIAGARTAAEPTTPVALPRPAPTHAHAPTHAPAARPHSAAGAQARVASLR